MIKSFKEFQSTKVRTSAGIAKMAFDYESANDCFNVLIYGDGYIIEEYINGSYQAIFGNVSFMNADLEQVEEVLWDDFVKQEYPLNQDDLEKDINDRCSNFLQTHELDMSLDEAIHNNTGGFTDEGMAYAKRLLEAWEYVFGKKKIDSNLSSICLMDNATCSVFMYHNVPGEDNEEIEHWIQEHSDHKLSECSWMAVENTEVKEVTL